MQQMDARFEVRQSPGMGWGLFARKDIAEGDFILEYTGAKIPTKVADASDSRYLFEIDSKWTIDGEGQENYARWINHSCDPNCEADEVEGRIFIKALRNIAAGEELHYDYGLIIDERYTPKLKAEYPCWCGAPTCRQTLLAPKRRR